MQTQYENDITTQWIRDKYGRAADVFDSMGRVTDSEGHVEAMRFGSYREVLRFNPAKPNYSVQIHKDGYGIFVVSQRVGMVPVAKPVKTTSLIKARKLAENMADNPIE